MAKTINDYKNDYEAAKKRGDKAGMAAAHQGAESIRAKLGYSGGVDGSQKIKLSNNTSSNKNNSNTNQWITTNDSYGGSYMKINNSQDYQALINDYVSKGDYVNAAKYEALRNAKIDYNGLDAKKTYNYVKTTNNGSGGTAYDSKYNSFSDLGSNWSSANVAGTNYKKDNTGIYEQSSANNWTYKGDGINSSTGEFTYSDRNAAKKEAVRQFLSSGNLAGSSYGEDSYDYIADNYIDSAYIDAISNGTTGEYAEEIKARVAAEQKAKEEAEAAAALEAWWKAWDEDKASQNSLSSSASTNENSFETDVNTEESAEDANKKAFDDYLQMLLYNSRRKRY